MGKVSYKPQRANTIPAQTPAPYKGLNTVDALVDMDPAYGISIQNFIATSQGLSVRQGYRIWSTGLPGFSSLEPGRERRDGWVLSLPSSSSFVSVPASPRRTVGSTCR